MLRATLTHETLARHSEGSGRDSPFGPQISRASSISSRSRTSSPSVQPFLPLNLDESGGKISSVVISGGSGANHLVDTFLALSNTCAFVLPISDNGGSSSELIRVIGGPSVGDIRSRLIRLIPAAPPGSPSDRIKNLLSHRLSSTASSQQVKSDWLAIVEGSSPLWSGVPVDRREAIRAFLVHLESELLKRARSLPEILVPILADAICSRRFNFRNGSIGNFFLAGALSFFRSLESAIFLFSALTGIPERARVVPCVFTNSVATIAAELQDGSRIVGQNDISHPHRTPTNDPIAIFEGQPMLLGDDDGLGFATPGDIDEREDADSMSMLVNKMEEHSLRSPIKDIQYINSFGRQVYPKPNPNYIKSLLSSKLLIYSCGSLWTSIIPCLALRGVGRAIATSTTLQYKVLLLNSQPDREMPAGSTGQDFISAIQRSLNKNLEAHDTEANVHFSAHDYITHILHLRGSQIKIDDPAAIQALGIELVEVESNDPTQPLFDDRNVHQALQSICSM